MYNLLKNSKNFVQKKDLKYFIKKVFKNDFTR